MTTEPWRRNLAAIAIAEFLVVMGFSFVNPFMPLYVQQVSGFVAEQAALWTGIASSASGIAMFFTAPLWGIVADRFGRKPMVLRAMFGTSVIVALIGIAPSISAIVGLRFAQGIFSGTVAAASALMASVTPRDRLPFAMGTLMTAVFTGTTVGPLVGGWTADHFGFRTAFFVTGGLLFSGGLVVLILVREKFVRPPQSERASLRGVLRLATSRQMLPLLFVIGAIQAGPQTISPVVSLIIRELDPSGGAATASGTAFALMGIVAAGSAWLSGRFGYRVGLKTILIVSCIGTSVLYLPPIWATSVTQFVILVAFTGMLKGGIVTSSNSLVSMTVPRSRQGIAFGVSQSAHALGNGLGPLIGGGLAPLLGLRPVFGAAGGGFLIIGLIVWRLLSGNGVTRDAPDRQPADDD